MNQKKEDNMNRRTFLKGSMGLAGLALAAPYVARAAGPLTLRFAHFAQEDHPANVAAKQFVSRVEARTDGAIKINIFPNNVLGGPPSALFGKMLILTAPPVRASTRLANCLAAILAGWSSCAKCAKRSVSGPAAARAT